MAGDVRRRRQQLHLTTQTGGVNLLLQCPPVRAVADDMQLPTQRLRRYLLPGGDQAVKPFLSA
ncbi:hypothetical protein D3C78_1848700 [compost metagenome]